LPTLLVNGDGYGDLLATSHDLIYQPPEPNGGGVLVFGRSSPTDVSQDTISGSEGFIFYCSDSNVSTDIGHSAISAGDFNGDGLPDIVFGSPFASGNSTSYIVFGRNTFSNTYDVCKMGAGEGVSIMSASYDEGFSDANIDSGDLNGGM